MRKFDTSRAEKILRGIAARPSLVESYAGYWFSLIPRSHEEYLDRWVFSSMSYLNTWQNNVKSYNAIRELGYPLNRFGLAGLIEKLKGIGCGIHDRRGQTLFAVDSDFWRDPAWWYPRPAESLTHFRERLRGKAFGLGMAKLSFVIEMLIPGSCEVICIDRHVLDIYGLEKETKVDDSTYRAMEAHWVATCRKFNLPAPLARHIMWDEKRDPPQTSTRYWSYVLETSPVQTVAL